MTGEARSAAQGHSDAELNEPRDLSTQRLAEIAFECLNAHGASLRKGLAHHERLGRRPHI